ncbi:MAG: hypothetical protein O7E57_11200 [Gammaproteobacteria bacterium]|nr:hypothetical protein [Gammaproteobacteria bacterium]
MNLVKFTLLFLVVTLSGCAATELTSLDSGQDRQIRLLAMACYKNNEGFRLVYGPAGVWEACRAKAEHKVRGSLVRDR